MKHVYVLNAAFGSATDGHGGWLYQLSWQISPPRIGRGRVPGVHCLPPPAELGVGSQVSRRTGSDRQ